MAVALTMAQVQRCDVIDAALAGHVTDKTLDNDVGNVDKNRGLGLEWRRCGCRHFGVV